MLIFRKHSNYFFTRKTLPKYNCMYGNRLAKTYDVRLIFCANVRYGCEQTQYNII